MKMPKKYVVEMKPDDAGKPIRIAYAAPNREKAAEGVCTFLRAPRHAVRRIYLFTPRGHYTCPVCGDVVRDTGRRTVEGRTIATCGDAHKRYPRKPRHTKSYSDADPGL